MPEAGPDAAIERFRGFLDGDEQHPGLTPWDLEAGVEAPPGVELRYHRESQTLSVRLEGRHLRFRWDGFRWVEEVEEPHEAPTPDDLAEVLLALTEAVRALEDRVARIEDLLRGVLGGKP